MIKYFKNFHLRKIIKNFNKGLFQDTKSSNEGIILCEFSSNSSNQVAFSLIEN